MTARVSGTRWVQVSLVLVLVVLSISTSAQSLLQKPVSLQAHGQSLATVLKDIGRQGRFTFSYNTDIVPADRLVTLTVQEQPVQRVLDLLFSGSCRYKETKGHIVLLPAGGKYFTISGYVVDGSTMQRMSQTSVYEKEQLVSSLTDDQGYFKLRLKNRFAASAIAVSKEWYVDTSVFVKPGVDQVVSIVLMPIRNVTLQDVVVTDPNRVEASWISRLFLGSRQRMQSLNLAGFFASRPYQFSVIPAVGSHGALAAQVVNKFSFNLLGGYSAGVNGFELGSVFNIDKQNMRWAQVAGVFNVVGGRVDGVQLAGVLNNVMDSVSGVEASGVYNFVRGDLEGVQLTGVYNHVAENAAGVQAAGVANFVRRKTRGVQLAGVANVAAQDMRGAQLSGLFNYAKTMTGLQMGVINVSDSSAGYSLGLLNLVRKNGIHQFSFSTNELLQANVTLQTGTRKLYSILSVGATHEAPGKAYAFGYGVGREFRFNRWCP